MAGFTTGFLHPLSGWDHIVAMVAELGLFDQDREGVGDSQHDLIARLHLVEARDGVPDLVGPDVALGALLGDRPLRTQSPTRNGQRVQ
jgi:hypothetical protein